MKNTHISALLKSQAAALLTKKAESSTGAPSTADGVAQVTKETPKKDPGEGELKTGMPTNGTVDESTSSMETSETNPTATPAADKGAPSELPKMASDRVAAIRGALFAAIPGLAPLQTKAATDVAPPAAIVQAATTPGTSKQAGELDLSPDMLIKLAKAMIATDEGIGFAQYTLEKAAGAEAASEMIKAARESAHAIDNLVFTKQAAVNGGFSKAASIHAELSGIITEDEAGEILKQAAMHCDILDSYDHPMLKAAHSAGMEDAAALEGSSDAGAAEPEMPMGGEQLSIKDVVALLQQMIANGEITAEEVAAGLAELQGGGGEAPMDPMAADPAAVDPAAAAEAPPMDPAAAAA